MPDVEKLSEHLKAHLRLCDEILRLVEQENVALKQAESSGNLQTHQAKKDLLPELEKSLEELRGYRTEWLKLTAADRAAHPEIAGLLRQNQDVIMKIIVLDRENEQTLLRKGMVPPKHLPSANRNRPHFVADLYKRGGGKT